MDPNTAGPGIGELDLSVQARAEPQLTLADRTSHLLISYVLIHHIRPTMYRSRTTRSLLYFLLVLSMSLPTVSAWFYFVLFSGNPVAKYLYVMVKVAMIAAPAIIVLSLEGGRPDLSRIRWRNHLSSSCLGLLTGVLISGVILVSYRYSPLGEIVHKHADDIRGAVRGLGFLEHYVLFCSVLAVMHSLLEEYYWRWFVHGRLAYFATNRSRYLLGGLAFAGHHYIILSCYFPSVHIFLFFGTCVGIGGIIWAWQYDRTASLLGSWISHLIVNFTLFSIGYDLIFRSGQ